MKKILRLLSAAILIPFLVSACASASVPTSADSQIAVMPETATWIPCKPGEKIIDVTEHGAIGNGFTDNTAVLQAAIKSAAKVNGTVFIPPGVYVTGPLRGASNIRITGSANFSFSKPGGSILQLKKDTDAKCLLDLTRCYGINVDNLCFVGNGNKDTSRTVHGIGVFKKTYGWQEDTPQIDHCRIEKFSGDAIHFERIWCFVVRHCHLFACGGSGIVVQGWDGFILDNWLSGNGGAGFRTLHENASVTLTGNRVEWNRKGGICVYGGIKYNITGNYIDRSGNSGLEMVDCSDIAVTGNVIYRSGKPEWSDPEKVSHVTIRKSAGIAFTGNSLAFGRDDGGKGKASPTVAMKLENLTDSIIANNSLHRAAVNELIQQKGTFTNCVIENNVGSVLRKK